MATTAAQRLNAQVTEILAECEKKVRVGLGQKKLSSEARKHWETRFRKTIKKRLQAGGVWEKEKKHPLRLCKKLGKVAALLANGRTVDLWAAEAAADAVKTDPSCPGGPGSGLWCEV